MCLCHRASRDFVHDCPYSLCLLGACVADQPAMSPPLQYLLFTTATLAAATTSRFPVMKLPALPVQPPTAADVAAVAAAPNASFEYVEQHPQCVVGIRDQGQCGSCWAFAATGSLADRTCIRTGNQTLLSPQDLLDCEWENLGCTLGSLPSMAWSFLRKKGVADEGCVPYSHLHPKKHACPSKCESGDPKRPSHVHKATDVTHHKGVAAIMAAVREGPVDVTFNVHSDFHIHWDRGGNTTYVQQKGHHFEGIHSVKLVGYGVDAAGTPYWTCENSWGCTGGFGFEAAPVRCSKPYVGGPGGYFRIRRGTNECGIESLVYSGWPAPPGAADDVEAEDQGAGLGDNEARE